tara:strand:- start:287 stop:937 length:651 start_codon:yes stop_codon:yes gene_type:complete
MKVFKKWVSGKRTFQEKLCTKCRGKGVVEKFLYIERGRCFDCHGTGKVVFSHFTDLADKEKADKRNAERNARRAKLHAEKRVIDQEAFLRTEEGKKFLENEMKKNKREEEWAKEKEESLEVPEGKIKLTGTIAHTKWQENGYGGSLKMLFKDKRGFKVWGTVPSSLLFDGKGNDQKDWESNKRGEVTFSFLATITRSEKDSKFGFFKRPSKVKRGA